MDRHFAYAVAAYVVPTFILGFVWHMVVFRKQYFHAPGASIEVHEVMGMPGM